MNVLFIPSDFPTASQPFRATYINDYACSLALRHEVTVIYPQQLGTPGVGNRHFFSESSPRPNFRYINYTYSHLRKSWLLSYLAAYRRIWRRMVREWKIDVIFAHVVTPAGVAALSLGKLLGKPVILTEHWGPSRDFLEWSPYPQRIQYTTLKNIYRRVDYLTAVSESLATEIKEVFGASTHGKLDYPIDCSIFGPAEDRPQNVKPRVLCVTRVDQDPRKGLANLLAAWELVHQCTNGTVTLDIIGSNVEDLAQRLNARGLRDSCNLYSWMTPAELASQMRNSDLIVIPSAYETFGRTGAEALASGVPVVATDCGGPREYIEEGTGLLVPINDPQSLAEGIVAGLERSRFLPPGQLAQRIRRRFSYETICDRFTEVASSLLNES